MRRKSTGSTLSSPVHESTVLRLRLPIGRVLVVDDDPDILNVVRTAMVHEGIDCVTAESGAHALERAIGGKIDLMLIDLRLRDMLGTEVIETLLALGQQIPFAVITGSGTVGTTVRAMKLGALDVIEKPFSVVDLLAKTRALLASNAATLVRGTRGAYYGSSPSSSAERWALLVLAGTRADRDPRTLSLWARAAGTSYPSLREACRLVRVVPHDARDFTRMLRAVLRLQTLAIAFEESLDVHDYRTWRLLLERSGFGGPTPTVSNAAVQSFLENQRFVSTANSGFRAVITLLRGFGTQGLL